MLQVITIGWLNRLVARMASEVLIDEMRTYNPRKLRRLAKYADKPPLDYPWDDPEASRVFWETYRNSVKVHGYGEYVR